MNPMNPILKQPEEPEEFNYSMAAGYTIRQLGGNSKVKERIICSKRQFKAYLAECAQRWFTENPPETERLYTAILEKLLENKE